jgi:hypothetical protein
LVCLHFFTGEGYSREFIDNLRCLLQRAAGDEDILVVEGADDVCRACPYLSENQCFHEPDAERKIRRLDESAMFFLEIKPSEKVKWQDLRLKVQSALSQWFSSFCDGCDWETLCQREQKTKNPRHVAGNTS